MSQALSKYISKSCVMFCYCFATEPRMFQYLPVRDLGECCNIIDVWRLKDIAIWSKYSRYLRDLTKSCHDE